MILIIGGAFQGKQEYARRLSGLGEEEFRLQTADGMASGEGASAPVSVWTSWEESVIKQLRGKRFLVNYHGFVRQAVSRGENVEEMTRQVLAAGPDIVTMDEVGCGIVPLEKTERDYREAVGAAGQILAAGAGEVYRMLAGLPVRIR